MEPQFRTSFVPKRPVSGATQKPTRRAPRRILFVLALVVLLASVILSVGLFFYQEFVRSNIERKGASLEAARGQLEPDIIQELVRLDTRLNTAETLLSGHTALTKMFAFLEDHTLTNVQFNNFKYEVLADGNISLSMDGRARNFAAVALQSDVFGRSDMLRTPVFEDLNVDETGDVTFSVSAFVDRGRLLYQPSDGLSEDSTFFEEEPETTTATSSVESETGTSTPQP